MAAVIYSLDITGGYIIGSAANLFNCSDYLICGRLGRVFPEAGAAGL
jgi:hypothetical protein